MAQQQEIYDLVRELGYLPQKDRTIVVRFKPENLSARVSNWFNVNNYYILQLCERHIMIIPIPMKLNKWGSGEFKPQSDDVHVIANESIKAIKLEEDGFNYSLSIMSDEQEILLTVEQKELSAVRTSGLVGMDSSDFWTVSLDNFHKRNFDATVADLNAIVGIK